MIVVPTEADRTRWFALQEEMAPAQKRVDDRRAAARPDFEAWLPNAKAQPFADSVPTEKLLLKADLGDPRRVR